MRHILSRPNRSVLAKFAQSRSLVAFDYDGTLAPIVREPAKAKLRARTRRLLRCLTGLYPCIVISGRSRADAVRRLQGTGVQSVVGNHGAETADNQAQIQNTITAWRHMLEFALDGWPGVFIEDKKLSLAVHYRKARRKAPTREAILEAAHLLTGARLVPAKQALNVMVDGAPHKGEVLQAECARLECQSAMFVGDDATDEDAFGSALTPNLLTVRVGAKSHSRAAYCLARQAEIDDLMQALIELRMDRC